MTHIVTRLQNLIEVEDDPSMLELYTTCLNELKRLFQRKNQDNIDRRLSELHAHLAEDRNDIIVQLREELRDARREIKRLRAELSGITPSPQG